MGMLMLINNIFLPEIDKKSCFECGSNEELHFHHPVPKSRGGTRTIPLCEPCHSKAHHRDKNMTTSKITKQALAITRKTRALGRSDRVQFGYRNIDGKKVSHQPEQAIGNMILSMRADGKKLKEVKDELDQKNIKTRTGNKYTVSGISHLARSFEGDK